MASAAAACACDSKCRQERGKRGAGLWRHWHKPTAVWVVARSKLRTSEQEGRSAVMHLRTCTDRSCTTMSASLAQQSERVRQELRAAQAAAHAVPLSHKRAWDAAQTVHQRRLISNSCRPKPRHQRGHSRVVVDHQSRVRTAACSPVVKAQ